MTAALPSGWPAWSEAEKPDVSVAPVRRMVIVSLALHLAVLAAVAGFHLPPKVERMTATHVTLVALPQPEPQPEAPVAPSPQAAPPASPPPTPKQAEPRARASAPIASKTPVLPSFKETIAAKAADSKLRAALKGIEQAPAAPRLGDYKPVQPGSRSVLNKLPDVPVDTKLREKPPSLSDVARELDALKQPHQQPVVASKPKASLKPVTAIQATGDPSGLGRYLSLVQARISEQWVAPPVNLTGKSHQVVIKFRLHRSGRISDVEIERASGNGYYDDAGKRAVQSVGQLPAFPPSVTEDILETHFTFIVAEEVG